MDEVAIKVLSPRIKRWSSMIEDFKFIEVRKEISRYFALNLNGQSFEDAYNELQRANHQGASTISTLSLIDVVMVSLLRYEFGNDVADIVNECLFNH